MAVQLLETWLLKEQAKIQKNYRELNQNPLREPDILFYRRLYRRILSPSRVAVDESVYGESGD